MVSVIFRLLNVKRSIPFHFFSPLFDNRISFSLLLINHGQCILKTYFSLSHSRRRRNTLGFVLYNECVLYWRALLTFLGCHCCWLVSGAQRTSHIAYTIFPSQTEIIRSSIYII